MAIEMPHTGQGQELKPRLPRKFPRRRLLAAAGAAAAAGTAYGIGKAFGVTIPGIASDGNGDGTSSQNLLPGETPTESATATPTPEPTKTPEVKEPQNPKEALAARGLSFGTQINPDLVKVPFNDQLVSKEFSLITPSVFSWDYVYRNGFDNPDFSLADKWVNYAKKNGMKVRGHNLFDNVGFSPDIQQGKFSPDQMKAMMEIHVKRFVTRYPEIEEWVVVNEPFWVAKGVTGYKPNPFYNAIGLDYIPFAFDLVRKYNSSAKRMLNSPGLESDNPFANFIFGKVEELKVQERIETVGFETHAVYPLGGNMSNPDPLNFPSEEELISQMNRCGKMGLRTSVTELDVDVSRMTGNDQEIASKVKKIFATVTRAAIKSGNCDGITVWGYDQNAVFVKKIGGKGFYLFEGNKPTDAYTGVFEAAK